MPAKGKSKITDKQRRQIAAGKVLGKTSWQIAKQVEVHPDTVRKAWADERTLTQITELRLKGADQVERIFFKALDNLESEFDKKTIKTLEPVDRHRCRMEAYKVGTLGDPPRAAVGKASADNTKGDITYEEMLIIVREVMIERRTISQ